MTMHPAAQPQPIKASAGYKKDCDGAAGHNSPARAVVLGTAGSSVHMQAHKMARCPAVARPLDPPPPVFGQFENMFSCLIPYISLVEYWPGLDL